MISDEEFDFIVNKYFAKIRGIGLKIAELDNADIPDKVEEINDTIKRIKEVRATQRKQRGEEE